MGDDPSTFVTNRWGRCQDVPNRWIGDGALHVTCAARNPTLTLPAVTTRNAEHLAEQVVRRDLRV